MNYYGLDIIINSVK